MLHLSERDVVLTKEGTFLPNKILYSRFLFTLDDKKCSTHISYSVNWQSLLKLIFEANFCSPRLIIYRNQAVTPPGRRLRHDNASQTSRLRRIPKEVEMVIKSATQSRQHGSRLQRHRKSGTTISNPVQTQVRANGMQ